MNTEPQVTKCFAKWPKIFSAKNMVSNCRTDDERIALMDVMYRAKIKIHGTNAAVTICPDGSVRAQSRTRVIVPGDDNYGFAAWVHTQLELFAKLAQETGPITVYGEWFGTGINAGTAANGCSRGWAIFGMLTPDGYVVEPETLTAMASPLLYRSDTVVVTVIPWHGDPVTAIRSPTGNLDPCVVSAVDAVGTNDAFIEHVFGVSGPGEGLVFYPYPSDMPLRDLGHVFKVKSESFDGVSKVPRQKPGHRVQDMERRLVAAEFAASLVPPSRISQGYDAVVSAGTNPGRSAIGATIAWIVNDIRAEDMAHVAGSGFTLKEFGPTIAALVRDWIHSMERASASRFGSAPRNA